MTTMVRDPLDMMGDLPNWPGNTPPKNRPDSKPREVRDRYNGAKPKIMRTHGVDTAFFSVGELAKALGRKAITIRMWETQGWIPKATYRTAPPAGPQLPGKPSKGRRLYSVAQLEFLINTAATYKIDDPIHNDWHGFRTHIKTNWPTK